MAQANTNWSEAIREMVTERLEDLGESDMTEAVILNERVRRPAPEGWNSLEVIKQWRRKTAL